MNNNFFQNSDKADSDISKLSTDNTPKLPIVESISKSGLNDIPTAKRSKLICSKAVKENGLYLEFVPNRFKTIDLCELALKQNPNSILFVPKNFITLGFVQSWLAKAENWLEVELNKDKKEHKSSKVIENINRRIYKLRKVMSTFPTDINNNNEVIQMQRKIGVRSFTAKIYDKERKHFITKEKILNQFETEEKHFSQFIEFYKYIGCDLRNSNLYDYDFKGINLENIDTSEAYISCDVLVEQNLYDKTYYNSIVPIDKSTLISSSAIENESIDAHSIMRVDDIQTGKLNDRDIRFYYISDIHLMHKIKNKFPLRATKKEISEYVKFIVSSLKKSSEKISYSDYLLIGGDISFDFDISKMFYQELAEQFECRKIIVILGNHELWNAKVNNTNNSLEYSSDNLQVTIEKYRDMFEELGITFLHNQLLVLHENQVRIATEEQIINISEKRLIEIALKSPFLLLAGLGFSGYNEEFNGSCGLYRNKIITKQDDVVETKKFEKLYLKLKQSIPNEKLIVFTHTPKSDWSNDTYNPNWIYVNGHTHRNEYTIDAVRTVYSDNQIGYKSTSFGLKSFHLTGTYDIFKHYEDGKYIIRKELYNDFNRGMKIRGTCNRDSKIIHMLKKNNNYCFFYEENNKLYLLNGGAIKKAGHQNIDYYFDRMDIYSKAVKTMLYKYNTVLKQISLEVKKIGGDGNIHGCIVDIDYFNHIYLNPVDGSVTPYFATDIVNKEVYPSVPALLELKAPALYNRYMQMLEDKTSTLSLKTSKNNIDVGMSKYVFDTSMYEPSRVMKSLQYITETNVIRSWNDNIVDNFQNESLNNQQYLEGKL